MSAETQHSHRKLDGAVAGGLAWTAGAKTATQLITWLSAIWAARLLSPADFGLVSMAGILLNITAVLSEFGLGTAALQMPELTADVIAQLNTASAAICTAIYGLTVLSAPLAAMFFKSDQLKVLLAVNSLALLITGFQAVPMALLQKDLDYRRLSVIDAVQAVLMAVVTVVCALLGLAYWSLVAGPLAGRLAGAALMYWWKPVPFKWPSWSQIEAAVRLGAHISVSRIASAIYVFSDGAIVGRTLGDSALGAYQWAMNLASAPADKVGLLLMRVTGPLFAKIQNDARLVQRYFRIVSEALSLTIFPMLLGLAVVAPEAVQALLGSKWAGAEGPIRWLALFVGVRTLATLVTQVLTSLRYTRFNMWVSLLSFAVMPPAFLIASRWGIAAVAASWLILAPVTILPPIVKLLRVTGLRYLEYLDVLAPALGGSAVMVALVLALKVWLGGIQMHAWAELAIEVAAGGAAYGVFLLLFYRTRLTRYLHFILDTRKGSQELAYTEMPKM